MRQKETFTKHRTPSNIDLNIKVLKKEILQSDGVTDVAYYEPETVESKRGGEIVARSEDELTGLRSNGHEQRKSRQHTLSPGGSGDYSLRG